MVEHKTCLNVAVKMRNKLDEAVNGRKEGFRKFNRDLAGLCAISSMALKKKLAKIGIKSKLFLGEFGDEGSHCWIVFGGKAYDLTATQFRKVKSKVLVTPVSSPRYSKVYKRGKKLNLF